MIEAASSVKIPPCEATPGCGLTRGHALSRPDRPCQVWAEPRPWKRIGYPTAAGIAAAHARWAKPRP